MQNIPHTRSDAPPQRPQIAEYKDPVAFIRDMIGFRKLTENGFTIYRATKSLRRVSPALVSLILQKKRSLTFDRVEEFSKLLNLNTSEKHYFKSWIGRRDIKDAVEPPQKQEGSQRGRKEVATSLLNDWINVYVKDFFQIRAVQKNPGLIDQQLLHVATPGRIRRAIEFLRREGYLRTTLDGSTVIETNLAVADPKVPSQKIRQFHKGALTIAKQAIDLYSPQERMANTLIVPLNEKSHEELVALIEDFGEKLKDFAAENTEPGERLYQLIINLSPVGGKLE